MGLADGKMNFAPPCVEQKNDIYKVQLLLMIYFRSHDKKTQKKMEKDVQRAVDLLSVAGNSIEEWAPEEWK